MGWIVSLPFSIECTCEERSRIWWFFCELCTFSWSIFEAGVRCTRRWDCDIFYYWFNENFNPILNVQLYTFRVFVRSLHWYFWTAKDQFALHLLKSSVSWSLNQLWYIDLCIHWSYISLFMFTLFRYQECSVWRIGNKKWFAL